MRAPLLVLVFLALATLVPSPAAAQVAQAAHPMITVELGTPQEPLVAGVPTTFQGIMKFSAEGTVMAETRGIEVVYSITNAPQWASVSVSPSSDVIQPGFTLTPTFQAARMFTITVIPTGTAPAGEAGVIAVTATSTRTLLVGSGSGQGAGVVLMADDPCDHEGATLREHFAVAIMEPATEEPEPEAEPVHQVQTASVTPLSISWAAVAGCVAVGAGGGYLLRKRRS